MKRILALVLSLMLLCAGFAEVAEEVAEEIAEPVEAYEFELFGLKWGSTAEEIEAAMGVCEEMWDEENLLLLDYMEVPVSRYIADSLSFVAENERLQAILYRWNLGLPAEDTEYLVKALSSKYGEPLPRDLDRCIAALMLLEDIEDEIPTLHGAWALEDGTYIAVCSLFGASFVYYVNEAELLELRGIYNTNGL